MSTKWCVCVFFLSSLTHEEEKILASSIAISLVILKQFRTTLTIFIPYYEIKAISSSTGQEDVSDSPLLDFQGNINTPRGCILFYYLATSSKVSLMRQTIRDTNSWTTPSIRLPVTTTSSWLTSVWSS